MCKIIKNNFQTVAGAIFLIVGLAHAIRVLLDWPLLVGLWEVPIWFSIIAAIILFTLAWFGLRKE